MRHWRVSTRSAEIGALALVLAACTPAPTVTPEQRLAQEAALTQRQMQILQLREADATATYGAPASVTAGAGGERLLRWAHPGCDLVLTVGAAGEVIESNFAAAPGDEGLLACQHWL